MKEEREIGMLLSAAAFLFEEKNFLLHCIGLSSQRSHFFSFSFQTPLSLRNPYPPELLPPLILPTPASITPFRPS